MDARGDHGLLEVGDKCVLQHSRGDIKRKEHHIPQQLDRVVRDLSEGSIPPILLENGGGVHLLHHAGRIEAGLADRAFPGAVLSQGFGAHLGVDLGVVEIECLIGVQTIQVERMVPLCIIYDYRNISDSLYQDSVATKIDLRQGERL